MIVDGPNLNPPFTLSAETVEIRAPGGLANVGGPYRCKIVGTTFDPGPPKAKASVDGVTQGADGNSVIEGCGQLFTGQTGGNLLVRGVTVNGSSGLDGSDGSGTSLAVGGGGGNAGPIALISDRDIDLEGINQFNGGNGGAGGDADATNNAPGGNATALAGHGGSLKPPGGLPAVIIVSNQGSINVGGELQVRLGRGGNGGEATARSGKGPDGNPGGKGGDAHASGGDGGDGQPAIRNAHGAVNITGDIKVTGGAGGDGGDASEIRGNGGAGLVPGAAGGKGGDGDYHGGRGGKGVKNGASPVAADGSLVHLSDPQNSPGGKGGAISDTGGNGGAAGPCPSGTPPTSKGPSGGAGGTSAGRPGAGGEGSTNGANGRGSITNASNGGAGGGGNPGGDGGLPGPDGSLPPGAPSGSIASSRPQGTTGDGTYDVSGSFVAGAPGSDCPGVSLNVSPPSQTVTVGGSGSVQAVIARLGGFTAAVTVIVKDHQGTTRATGTIPAGSTTLDLFFPIPGGFPTGTNIWTVTVSLNGTDLASKTFSVTVNAVTGTLIVWTNCNNETPIVYAAWYDGIGSAPWTQLTITNQSDRQSVSFTATQSKVGFVVVTRRPDGLSVKTAGYYMLRPELKTEADQSCHDTMVGTNTVTGAINNPQGQGAWIAAGNSRISFADARSAYTLDKVLPGPLDVVYTHQASLEVFDRWQYFPNWAVPGPGPTIDVTQGFPLQQATATLNGTAGRNDFLQNRLLTATTTAFLQRSSFNTATTRNIYGVQSGQMPAGSIMEFTALVQGTNDFEEEIRYLTTFGNQVVTFPAALADYTVTEIGTDPVRIQASGTVPAGIDQLSLKDITQTQGGVNREWQLWYSAGWNDNAATYNWGQWDLSSAGYPKPYGFQQGAPLNITVEWFGSNLAGGALDPARTNGKLVTLVGRTKTFTPVP